MKLPTEIFGEVIVVHTPEELGGDTSTEFEKFIMTLERCNVVLDLDGTESLESAGLEAILNAQEGLRELQGDLKISTSNASNQKILEITRLDQQFEVYESVLEAVRSFV
ncbi:MAG: STAS domain-containing protein [Planctomycetales bacterium]|nr:STAS domain-containing protein [Planctomycetales bacterium]